MPRAEFPDRIKVKRLAFADFKCEGIVTRDDGTKTRCNATLIRGRVQFDHDNPDGLTGDATFSNCRALCKACHADKTPLDVAAIAKAKRREAAHVGASAPKGQIKSAGFAKSEKPKHERKMLAPRKLYEDAS